MVFGMCHLDIIVFRWYGFSPRFGNAVSKPNLGSRSNSWGLTRNGENCEKQVILFLEFLENTYLCMENLKILILLWIQ